MTSSAALSVEGVIFLPVTVPFFFCRGLPVRKYLYPHGNEMYL